MKATAQRDPSPTNRSSQGDRPWVVVSQAVV